MIVYYALPIATRNAFGEAWKLSDFQSAIFALSLNTAAYLAETIRGAIQSIDKGQMEAASALGMSYNQAMFKIIIPQSYRRLLPPVGNEFIMLLKDSSLVSVIGIMETLRVARVMVNSSGKASFYVIAAAIYLALTTVFTLIFQKLEKKYSAYE
jgi:polar amino acid transport system permease protein